MFQTRQIVDKTSIWVSPANYIVDWDWNEWCSAVLQWTKNALNSAMIDPSWHLSIADICARFHAPASDERYGKYRKFVDRWRELGLQFVEFEYTTNNPVDLVISATVAGQTFIIVDLPKRFWDGLDDDGRLTYKLLGPAAVRGSTAVMMEPQTASVTQLAPQPQSALATPGQVPQQAILQPAPQSGPMLLAANQGVVGGLNQLLQLKKPL